MDESGAVTGRPPAAALLVVGMHRSGSSALTRALNLAGLELGPHLLPPGEDNPKGFWESRPTVRLHRALLAELGSSWYDTRPLPEGWSRGPAANRTAADLETFLAAHFHDARPWGVKDPRLARLLPLWEGLLSRRGTPWASVLVLRHPFEVALSLRRRDALDPTYGVLLWLTYQLDAERHTRSRPRVVVPFDALLDRPHATLGRIRDATGVALPEAGAAGTRAALEEFLSPALRRHRLDAPAGEDHGVDPEVGALGRDAYQAFEEAAAPGGVLDPEAMERLRERLRTLRPLRELEARERTRMAERAAEAPRPS